TKATEGEFLAEGGGVR
nr:RecName: Full=Fibrinogen alpha chain; Contains: RecName: Full=Fibrinopeptide A [Tapirus terrestris]prf//721948C fibrinopeptide A [Tapirus sp.]